jgi:rod shape determining protein RodA
VLFILVCAFAVFGVIMVSSASHVEGNLLEMLRTTQGVFLATGFVVLLAATLIDYHFIAKFYIPIYIFMLLLLAALLIIGPDDSNTARWINYKSFSIQPSEFSKLFVILFLSKLIDKRHEIFNNIWILLLILLLMAVPVVMVALQPSLSACLVIVVTVAFILFGARLKVRYIIGALLIIVPIVSFFYWDWNNPQHLVIDKLLKEYQIKRIETLLQPKERSNEYYQVNLSLHSIGSGMLSGKGLGKSSYIPAGTNDFIFSVLGAEFGFLGCFASLCVMLLIIAKCLLIANRAPDMLGRLIAIGVAGMMAFEVFVNVGVATFILPNTGMPFPFLSSGGSTMWVHMGAIGFVLNVGLFKTKSIFKG